MTPSTARLATVAAAVLFSTGGAVVKTLAFTSAQVSCLRSGIAMLVLWGYARGRLPISRPILWASMCYAATLTLFVASTKGTTAANAIFLQSVAPLYIFACGPWFLRERWTARDLPHMAALAAGLVLCLSGQTDATTSAPDPSMGNAYGALSGLTWAGTLLWLRRIGRESPDERGGLAVVVIGNGLAALVALPAAWPFPAAPTDAWAGVAYLGVFQIGVAYLCLTRAIRHISALEVSLLLLIEPVLNPLWTWLGHAERPGTATLLGGAVIVSATAVRAVTSAHRRA